MDLKDQQEKAPRYAIEIKSETFTHRQYIEDQEDMDILMEVLKKIERNANQIVQDSK